ncbi:MAG: carboxypeptidase regulatory-like domain-containing protein, partial [Bryobacteraceae bacterium]
MFSVCPFVRDSRWFQKLLTAVALMPVLFTTAPDLKAQVITGQITGRITDASGAVVADVQVKVTQTATGVSRTVQTNAEGYYTAPLLAPGAYEVFTEKPGFKASHVSNIDIRVNQINRIDLTLELGTVSETVTVAASAVALETETGSLATDVTRRSLENLPLNTRDAYRLAFLSPGTVPMRAYGDDYVGTARILINGGRPMSNDYSIDGITSTMPGALPEQFVTVYPSPDAVEEIKVQTNSFSAEFGRTGGGVINTVIKSGTNEFHGTVYEFLRNSKMDANNFFANRAGVPLASFKRNQFGGTIGGPVVPDRLFFFFSYEGLQQRALQSRTDTVPTVAERNGDFSQVFRRVGSACVPVQIFDPTTTRTAPSGTGFVRSPFPGNLVPATRWDRAGASLVNLYPLPTSRGDACTGINNYFGSGTQTYNTNEFDGKLDWAPNQKDHAFFAVSSFSPVTIAPNLYRTIADPNGSAISGQRGPAKVARIDYTHVHSPTLISNLRFGVVRWTISQPPYPGDFNPTSIGFSPTLAAQMSQPTTFPNVTVTGYSALGPGLGFINQASTSYNWKGSISKSFSSHNLKVGGEFRVLQTFEYSGLGTNGSFAFGQGYTQGPDPNIARSDLGEGIASLLLGTGTGTVQIYPSLFTSSKYSGLFVQDQWKVTP